MNYEQVELIETIIEDYRRDEVVESLMAAMKESAAARQVLSELLVEKYGEA